MRQRLPLVGLVAAALWMPLTPAIALGDGGVSVHEATEEQKALAQARFLEARRAFDERRFIDAIAGFRSSYSVVASPNTHLMIAHAMREMGRYAEAYETLQAVAEEAEKAAAIDAKYNETASLARDEQAAMRAKICLLTVRIEAPQPSATLTISGRAIPESRWSEPIAVDPGNVTVIYKTGGDTIVQEVATTAGGEATTTIAKPVADAPEKPPTPDDGYRWQWTGTQRYIAYAVSGLGAGALIGSAVTGGLALGKYGELEDACGDAPCPERQSDIDAGRTLMTVTNGLLIGGGVLLAVGVTLYFTAPDEPTDAQLVTALRIGPGSLLLEGQF